MEGYLLTEKMRCAVLKLYLQIIEIFFYLKQLCIARAIVICKVANLVWKKLNFIDF